MKAVLVLLFSVVSFAQTNIWVQTWSTNPTAPNPQWVQLGTGFSVINGVLTFTASTTPAPTRIYEQVLTANTSGQYPLPVPTANPATVAVWVNGARYYRPRDFTIVNGVIIPACVAGVITCNWPPASVTSIVLVDYDKQ